MTSCDILCFNDITILIQSKINNMKRLPTKTWTWYLTSSQQLASISVICQTWTVLSSATLEITHGSFLFHEKSDIFDLCSPWESSSPGGPSSASNSSYSSPIWNHQLHEINFDFPGRKYLYSIHRIQSKSEGYGSIRKKDKSSKDLHIAWDHW